MAYINIRKANEIEAMILEIASNLAEKEIPANATMSSLMAVGIDSLGIFQIISEVEQKLGISIPDDALPNEDATIAQLAQNISEIQMGSDKVFYAEPA